MSLMINLWKKSFRRAEDLARLAPENPEFMSAVAKQGYKETPTFVQKRLISILNSMPKLLPIRSKPAAKKFGNRWFLYRCQRFHWHC